MDAGIDAVSLGLLLHDNSLNGVDNNLNTINNERNFPLKSFNDAKKDKIKMVAGAGIAISFDMAPCRMTWRTY